MVVHQGFFFDIAYVMYRYCRRAKAVFKELKQVPYVIELDERGIFLCVTLFPLNLCSANEKLWQLGRKVMRFFPEFL